jgi:hypothetical protein
MASHLAQFLDEAAGWRVQLGVCDCMLWTADWVMTCGYPDSAAPWRGTYSTEGGAARIITRAGGVVELMRGGMAGIWPEIDPADTWPGAIGIIERATEAGMEKVGAIRTATGWATLDANGIAIGPAYALAAWEAP